MAPGTLPFGRYLDHVAAEASRFDTAISTAPDGVQVPACPDWDRSALRGHQAGVLAFWIRQLADDADPGGPVMEGVVEQAERRVVDLADDVVSRLRQVGPDRPCWNWSGVDQHSGWTARRMAQEISVHRVDAESITGAVTPIEDDLAADGIDELLDVFVTAPPGSAPGDGVVVELLDAGHRAVLTADGAIRTKAAPDAVLAGTPADVLLALWGRDSGASWSGDVARASAAWADLASFS